MRRMCGHTLIELLIAIAIFGILAAIALPSFSHYIHKSKVEKVRAVALSAATAQERFFSANGRYAGLMSELQNYGMQGMTVANNIGTFDGVRIVTAIIANNSVDMTGFSYIIIAKQQIVDTTTFNECWAVTGNTARKSGPESLIRLQDASAQTRHADCGSTNPCTIQGIVNCQ